MSLPAHLAATLGEPAASRLIALGGRVSAPPASDLAPLLAAHGLHPFPELTRFEHTFGGLEHRAPEYPADDPDARWGYGTRTLLGPYSWPANTEPAALRRGGLPLVPVACHPDGTLFLQDDGGIISHLPFSGELIRMADSAVFFVRRQLHAWATTVPYAHQADGQHGAAWAALLGLAVDHTLSDSLERWWIGQGLEIQEVSRQGDAVWRAARGDGGHAGRHTILWAVTPEELQVVSSRIAP